MRNVLVVATLLLCSCGQSFQAGGAEPVSLSVDRGSVARGQSITLVLRNDGTSSVGYNLCTSALERMAGEEWRPVPSDRVCTMELRTLQPGARATYPLELPATLEPGEYRVLTNVEMLDAGERGPVRSGTFRVTG